MHKGLKRLTITLISCLALYSWLGFLLLPSIALKVINQQLAVYANSPAQLQRLEFNPFTLELFAWGFHLGEADTPQLSLQQLYGKLAYDSLWTKTLHLRDVQLLQPQAQVVLNPQGELNLTQLFNLPSSPAQPEAPQSSAIAVLIDQIQLQHGSARFNDQRQQDPVDFRLADLNITLNDFDTRPASSSALQLSAQADDGTQLQWQGDISIQPFTSQGHLQLNNAKLSSWWPYVREYFSAQLADGRFSLDSHYQLALSPKLQFQASQLSAQINDLKLNQQQQPLARLAQLSISNSSFDLIKQELQLGQVNSSKLEAWAEIDKNGVINWQRLLANPHTKTENNADAATKVSTQPAEPSSRQAQAGPEWRIIVKQAKFSEHQFHLADHSQSQPVAIELSKFNLLIKDFDSQAQTPFSAQLDTQVGEQGQLSSQAQVLLQPLQVKMSVNSRDLDLRPAQAWISPYAHVELRSGLLNSALQVQVSDEAPLQVSINGDASVTQLHMRDNLRQRDLLKWQSVAINELQYALQQNALSIKKIVLQEPYVRFIINEDLTTNISELLIPQAPQAPVEKPTNSPEFALHIGGIDIKEGTANFADFSLNPSFATAIQQLNGHIGTLDNQRNSIAQVDIKGAVDRYAPVTIKGSLMPFDPLKKLDIATSFKHVELTTLTPYSGKFAGYRIKKGRLNLDLNYKISDGKLNASNQLLLEQLQLGERVDSPDAVDLPVRLAIALLKDRKGQIAIDLPVQGDLNNPEFRVAPLVWQTLRNLITRAVSAPFNFIAGLATDNSQELSEVSFLAGDYKINAEAAKRLDTLAQALKDRPELRLEIEGGSRADLDGPPLAQLRLMAAYQNAWYSILQQRGTKIDSSKDDLEVPEKEKAALLESIYRTQLKQQPPAEWAELKKDEREQRLREAVLQSYAQSPLGLRRLAQARANSIKEYLIEQQQLDPQQVYLLDAGTGKVSADQGVISTLHLGSM
ncbi:MAG: DUF748 domain-containing protein [Gammaproteobacteria bacterium]|nr:DUF748 domain-containing protein [Gammaproteobacteria bacterium]